LGIGSGHTLLMMILSKRGDLAGAERHFIAGQPYYELPEYRFQLLSGGIVAVFGHAARNAWMSGWTELARQRLAKIAAAAAESNNPWFQAFAHHLTARVLNYMRDYDQAEHAAGLGLELSERIALPEFAAYLRFDLGWARASTGRSAEGISLMRQAVEELRKLGIPLDYEPKVQLAQGLECAGATTEALEIVEQAERNELGGTLLSSGGAPNSR
jgi:tetratricopeptide (TPR) repeat protein